MKGYINIYKKNNLYYDYKSKLSQLLRNYLDLEVNIDEYSGDRVISYLFTNEPKYDMLNINQKESNIVLGYAGYILEKDEILYRRMVKGNQDGYIGSLNGIFSLSMTDLNKNKFTIWNNVTGVEPVYWCETDEHIIAGNKALLVHLLAFKLNKPVYKVENLVSFLNNGYYTDDKTPFLNLNVLPVNSKITAINGKVFINEIDDLLDNVYTIVPDKKMYDDITDSFLNSYRGLKDHTGLSLGLTGGKDSRMIVSGLHKLGVDFKSITNGYPDNPDVIVARQISEKLNIEHKINEPAKSGVKELKINLLKRAYQTIKSSEGMLYAYENVTLRSSFNPEQVKLGGQGGELLRGGFAKTSNVKTIKELEKTFRNGFARYLDIINDDLADSYWKELIGYIDSHRHFIDPKDVLNKFYLETRSARWSGASKPVYTMSSYSYTPLMDSKLIRQIQLLETKYGSNEYVIYNILSRIEPQLLDVPFANDRWSFEADHPREKNELYRWIKRKPIYPKTTTASFNWRVNVLGNFKNEFYEGICANENSPIFDIINKEKVKKLFDIKMKKTAYYDKFLWSLYTANIMLSNKWITAESKGRTSSFKIPEKKETTNNNILQEIRPIPSRILETKHKMLKIENIEDLSATIQLNGKIDTSQNYYIQVFDEPFTKPPLEKNSLASVKGFSKVKFIFEVTKKDNKEIPLEVYFMQYDKNSRLSSEKSNVLVKSKSQFVSIVSNILVNATHFKVAIKIKGIPGERMLCINQMRLEGYK